MSLRANVLKVMIASPGDVAEARTIATEEIYRWNDANASARQLVLLPVKWETHSTPEMGDSPQSIINRQLLREADIVIAIFGTRIGTPTEEYISGTVEEIKKHVAASKTAMIYFSDVPVPPSVVNAAQYALVQEFRDECRSLGLYATFDSLPEFRSKFSQHLNIKMNEPTYRWLAAPEPSGALEERASDSDFEKHQESHTRTLIDNLTFIQRDLLRILLLKGGSARNDVIAAASTNSAGAVDMNNLFQPLVSNGLITRKDDRTDGHSTFTINTGMSDPLRRLLIPRKEENDTPYFKGIPLARR